MTVPTNKDLQDAFMEGFCYAEDIGHTTGKKEYRISDDNYEPPEPDMNADGPAERAHRDDEARRMK